jgi:UPF0755 protein
VPKLPIEEWQKKLLQVESLKKLQGKLSQGLPQHFPEDWREKIPANKKIWGSLAVVFMFLIICIGYTVRSVPTTQPYAAMDSKQAVYLKVKPGMNAREIGGLLEQHGVIESQLKFWFIAKLNGYDSKFKAGTYAFSHDMEPREVLRILMDGSTSKVKFVIPEGFTVKQIAKRLSDEGLVDEKGFLAAAEDFAPYAYMEKDKDAKYTAEGFLFPATYELASDVTAKGILEIMTKNFDDRLTADMRSRAKAEHLSIYELVTLASLVEKEARYEKDRPIIAQVLLKRLRIGMPLQSDATLQYLLDAPKENVSIADTKVASPYNSYQNKGLPPGPIANPGMAAIEAVLHPADTDYLYFVADRDGHNHYAYTYEEHMKNVDAVR